MISKEQIERCEKEFSDAAAIAFSKAKDAERTLETATYAPSRVYDPTRRQKLLNEFHDADYEAESRAFILALLRRARGQGVKNIFFATGKNSNNGKEAIVVADDVGSVLQLLPDHNFGSGENWSIEKIGTAAEGVADEVLSMVDSLTIASVPHNAGVKPPGRDDPPKTPCPVSLLPIAGPLGRMTLRKEIGLIFMTENSYWPAAEHRSAAE